MILFCNLVWAEAEVLQDQLHRVDLWTNQDLLLRNRDHQIVELICLPYVLHLKQPVRYEAEQMG
jgi:hypothetical protein